MLRDARTSHPGLCTRACTACKQTPAGAPTCRLSRRPANDQQASVIPPFLLPSSFRPPSSVESLLRPAAPPAFLTPNALLTPPTPTPCQLQLALITPPPCLLQLALLTPPPAAAPLPSLLRPLPCRRPPTRLTALLRLRTPPSSPSSSLRPAGRSFLPPSALLGVVLTPPRCLVAGGYSALLTLPAASSQASFDGLPPSLLDRPPCSRRLHTLPGRLTGLVALPPSSSLLPAPC